MTSDRNLPEIAAVRESLAELGHPWQAAETRMSRLPEEWRNARLGVPTPTDAEIAARTGQPDAMAAAAQSALGQQVSAAGAPGISLPASFDLRNVGGRNFVTPIRDQGGCGSCVSFGTLASMESTAAYTRGTPGMNLNLSEAHLYHVHAKARGYTCASGSWPDDLYGDCVTKGVTFEDYFPYNDNGSGTVNADWPNRLAKAVGLVNLTGNPAAMKQHIYSYGAIESCFVVYSDFMHYKTGVYKHTTNSVAGGHCVSLIGWDDAAGCWIGKNSWGTGWGENGFFRIAYGDSFIEDYPGDRATVFGCTGVNLRAWLPAQRTLRLFATANDANGWAYLEHYGWTHLAGGPNTTTNKLAELTHARGSGHAVTPFINGNELSTVQVHD
ncbi:C1A family cysteine protease [Herbihabitans rhizosphaerae]|uniref:C1A family cysteine protease n=1 Tax=Herbihabitans rhizosphaerae TaxID=1872711 RepID=A0A4Q7KXM6_9PSEU|nr:C1 family peptidase [Herbihabitans rhizosphaerae]RZS41080.1 C1A family cysteine protease [Herbihabitans rhizosphaerae]